MIRETSNLADGANLNFLDSSYHDVIILLLTPVIIVGKGWKGRRKEYFCSSLSSFFPSNQKKREKIIDFSRSFGWIFSGKESVSKYSSHCITFIFREIELFPFLFGLFPRLIFQFCHFFFKFNSKASDIYFQIISFVYWNSILFSLESFNTKSEERGNVEGIFVPRNLAVIFVKQQPVRTKDK